jgi:hypothetical protein
MHKIFLGGAGAACWEGDAGGADPPLLAFVFDWSATAVTEKSAEKYSSSASAKPSASESCRTFNFRT